MSQNAIELRGLKKTYAATKKTEAKTALSGIDLDIPRGSIFGLLGPNGAGKSTLINILAGLVKKSAGSVNIWGFDQDENPRQSRAAIGVMPQELNLDPFFTPGASLDMQAGLYGVPKALRKTDEILRRRPCGRSDVIEKPCQEIVDPAIGTRPSFCAINPPMLSISSNSSFSCLPLQAQTWKRV